MKETLGSLVKLSDSPYNTIAQHFNGSCDWCQSAYSSAGQHITLVRSPITRTQPSFGDLAIIEHNITEIIANVPCLRTNIKPPLSTQLKSRQIRLQAKRVPQAETLRLTSAHIAFLEMHLHKSSNDLQETRRQPSQKSVEVQQCIKHTQTTIRFHLPSERHEGPQFARLRRAPSPYPCIFSKPDSRMSKAIKSFKRCFTKPRKPARHQNPVKTSRVVRNYPEYENGMTDTYSGEGREEEARCSRVRADWEIGSWCFSY